MTLSEYDSMDELDKQIEEAKARLKKTQQLAELNTLQQQASAMNKPPAPPTNDPMQRMIKLAFPVGVAMAGIGMALDILFAQFALGLLLVAFGAVAIGFAIALTPGMKIPLLDKIAPPKQEVK